MRLSAPTVAASSPPTDDMEADYEEEQEEIPEPMEPVPELWVFFFFAHDNIKLLLMSYSLF